MSLNEIKVGLTIIKDQPFIQSSGFGVWFGRSIRPIGQALLLKNPIVLTVAFIALTILTVSFIVYQYQKNKFLENEIANFKENSRLDIEDLRTKFSELNNCQKEHSPNEQPLLPLLPLPLPLFVEIKNELEAPKQEEKKIEITDLPHPSLLFASFKTTQEVEIIEKTDDIYKVENNISDPNVVLTTNKKEIPTTSPLTTSRTNSAVEEEKKTTLTFLEGITQGRLGLKPAGERKIKETIKEPSLIDNLSAHPLLINANQNKTDHADNRDWENDEVDNEKSSESIINETKEDDLPPSYLPPSYLPPSYLPPSGLPPSDLPPFELINEIKEEPVLSVQEKIANTIREAELKKAREAEEAEQILREMGL